MPGFDLKVRRTLKPALVLGVLLVGVAASEAARASEPLVPSLEQVGFSLDDDWQERWRRILDRHGRIDELGPIQQRYAGDHRPETEEAIAVSDYALSDEWSWARAERGVRWWVHSYDATRLGTHAQLKHGGPISSTWRFRVRFDRLYTPAAQSDLFQGEFVWTPSGERGPYASISFFPRIEKQDTDLGFAVGYRDGRYGEARLRLFGLDLFSNAAYSLATTFDFSPGTAILRQLTLPLAFALEVESLRVANLRLEAYVGSLVPMRREVYTEEFARVRQQEEAAFLFGGLLEYAVPGAPLWAGVSVLGFLTRWQDEDRDVPANRQLILEQTYQSRAYMLAVFDPNLRLETQFRYTTRPEQRLGPGGAHTRRQDMEYVYHTRLEWLISRRAGLDLSYWRTFREASGLPEANVTGRALRFDIRMLLRYDRFLASFGVGLNPLPDRAVYSGGGGKMVFLFD